MKKFLAYLLVIVITVSLGFAVFYLVRDDEKIALSTTTLYRDKGESFELKLDMSKNNSYTKISVSSSNENVLSITKKDINVKKGIAKATFQANEGGVVRVNFQTNNSKFRNLYCDITIGDGSEQNPYHIESAEQFALIGKDEKYTLESHYEIVSNINLSLGDSEVWTPIGSKDNAFKGSIIGNGHTISGVTISNATEDIGIFSCIGAGAKIDNLKFKNIIVESNTNTSTMGVVAGINNGTLTRVEVSDCVLANNNKNTYVGGIVGKNESTSTTSPNTASIIRASVNAKFVGSTNADAEINAISGKIGGIAGQNLGGKIAYTYTKSPNKVVISQNCQVFGGIIGENKYASVDLSNYHSSLKGFLRDSYTILSVDTTSKSTSCDIGAVVGSNTEQSGDDKQQIYGCYYAQEYFASGINGVGSGATSGDYVAGGKALADMKSLSNYISHEEKEPKLNNSGQVEYESTGIFIYWNKDIWSVSSGINDGFPVLDMGAMDVSVDIISGKFEVISDIRDLYTKISSDLSGNYMIKNMDASSSEWVPIGTEKNPFTGVLMGENDQIVISNLTIKTYIPYPNQAINASTDNQGYAGLVVYNKGTIKNIKIQNVTIDKPGTVYAGAFAAVNEGTIDSCAVESGKITSGTNDQKSFIGGIAGQNKGKITNCSVIGTNGNALTLSLTTQRNLGGIAGQNTGTIDKAIVSDNVEIKQSDSNLCNVGGIVGENTGNVSNATVSEISIDTKGANDVNVGGIVGSNEGNISYTYSHLTIDTNSQSVGTYVGGVAGYFKANVVNDVSTCIKYAKVEKSTLEGYYVGGIVGGLNTDYNQEYTIDSSWLRNLKAYGEYSKINSKTYSNYLKYAIYAVGVENDVELKGEYAGGIAYNITNGVVLDAYTQAILSANNNAGIVYDIKFNAKDKTGGLMNRIIAIVKFNDKKDSNYSVSSSDIHRKNSNSRSAGFIDDYYYVVLEGKAKDPKYNSTYLFFSDNNKKSEKEIKSETLFSENVWNFSNGSFPTINGLLTSN